MILSQAPNIKIAQRRPRYSLLGFNESGGGGPGHQGCHAQLGTPEWQQTSRPTQPPDQRGQMENRRPEEEHAAVQERTFTHCLSTSYL